MFNWLGNLFPYSDLHSLNLDWILSKMKETAAQAAKAVADAANALAQVTEAKAAALSAQTAAQDAQTAAQNAQTAANNAADSAENAVAVAQAAKSAAQTAQNTANTAQSTAQTAQSTAETAQTAAQNAQNTAETAQTAAQNAQNTAETAQTAANEAKTSVSELSSKFPIKREDIKDRAVDTNKIAASAVTSAEIANSAVTSNKISNDVIFGFQYDNSSNSAPINSTATPVTLKAPTFPGRRAAYLGFSTTVEGYSLIPSRIFLSIDFRDTVVYMSTLEIMNDTTMEVTRYIVKYKDNTLTLYTPGTVESQNIVIPLSANVSTYKSVKTT